MSSSARPGARWGWAGQQVSDPALRTCPLRLRRGRRPSLSGRLRCAVQLQVGQSWRPCPNAPHRLLQNGRTVCRACFASAERQGLPWAVAVTAEPQDIGVQPRRRGGPRGDAKAPPPEVARANRERLHALMVAEGRIRPVDLPAALEAVQSSEAPPWAFAEAAQLLAAPRGTITGAHVSAVWKGQRGLPQGWAYQGQPFTSWPLPSPGGAP